MALGYDASHSTDSKRAELEVVLEALARTPRLANLLRFLGERSLQGRASEITEYNIAVEVFGRSKVHFDGSRDSIARVETHRLRKRLKEYYGLEGKEHEIQISIPFRSYVPEFNCHAVSISAVERTEPAEDTEEIKELSSDLTPDTEETHSVVEVEPSEASLSRARVPPKRTLVYAALAAVTILILVSLGASRFFKRGTFADPADSARANSSSASQSPTPADAAQVPLRLLAGYEGSPRIDSAGNYWQPDRYFRGGAAFRRPAATVTRTSDQMLFDYWRVGDFNYDIPLAPGPYELHLYFVAPEPEDFKTSGFFDVSVNGKLLLKGFNIYSDALGSNIADERVFKDVYPDKDGHLHLAFLQERSSPSLNAIEILPGLPHRQLPIRLAMQTVAITDHSGNLWHPDTYFQNGTFSDQPRQVSGTPDPKLYERERYGHFTYSIPVDTRGRYTLVLHFAELYWVPEPSDSAHVGSRVFRVYCNGSTLLDNFDIFKEVGSLHALTKTFNHLRPSPEGKLDLTFDPIANFATVSAIEVIDESE